jgi:hypothetical protein
VRREHPDLPEDASIELKILWPTLRKCWSRDPQQRPNIMQLIRERYFDPTADLRSHDCGSDSDTDGIDHVIAVSCFSPNPDYRLLETDTC